jgi:hypothetical protein
VTQSNMDLNDLSRFADGRMPPSERESAIAHFAESDGDAELLGDVAYMLRDLEGQEGVVIDPPADADDAETKVIPLRPPSTARTRPRLPARWLAMAAMVAGVLLVPLALSRSGGGPGDPGQYAALLERREAGLPADWMDIPRWPVTRGGGGDPMIDNARAARLGALQVDLELAVAARQADETRLLAAQIENMLGDVAAGGAVASTYRDIGAQAGEPPEAVAELLEEGRESVAMFVDEDHFALGAWTEAARIAVRQQDEAFFRARASRKMLDRAASLPSLDEEARSAVEAIRAALPREGQPDWTRLQTDTDQLLRSLGG